MDLFSYVVARDYGFAPNPFNGVCTLATCKPVIRKQAKVGDWVIGTGAKKKHNISGRLIYAMKVTDKMTFDEYWVNPTYQIKKAHMNGSLKQAFGDNIYFFNKDKNVWHQENSHHSYASGDINYNNLNRDTKYPFVLISTHFFYFGSKNICIPQAFTELITKTQGIKRYHDPNKVDAFINWLESNHDVGFKADPLQFQSFVRYNGIS